MIWKEGLDELGSAVAESGCGLFRLCIRLLNGNWHLMVMPGALIEMDLEAKTLEGAEREAGRLFIDCVDEAMDAAFEKSDNRERAETPLCRMTLTDGRMCLELTQGGSSLLKIASDISDLLLLLEANPKVRLQVIKEDRYGEETVERDEEIDFRELPVSMEDVKDSLAAALTRAMQESRN